MRKSPNILSRLKKYAEFSKEIDIQAKTLETQVGHAKLTAIDGFRPYINPKRNIDNLLSFYNTFMSAKESIEAEQDKINGIFGEVKDKEGFSPRDLKILKEKNMLESTQTLIGVDGMLKEYSNIRMVAVELESLGRFIKKVMDAISESFFISLKKLPEKDPELQEFAAFLLLNSDRRVFISKYTNIIYLMLGFDDIGANTKLLLERTNNLTEFFSDIIEMNDRVLGVENSKITNVGLLKMFIIGLRRVIADDLIRAEKEEKIESVPFLINLNSHLRHSAGPKIKVIEELFVFKDEINKIICNCITGYFEALDMLMDPSRCSDIESLCLKIINVLNAFYDNKKVAEAFAAEYGASFNVKTAQDIFVEFSSRTIEKILFLAESLKGISKSVYIINNVYAIQNYLEKVNGTPAHDMIRKNVESILSVWKKEISKRKESDITEFLDKNIENQSKYLLPEEIRDELVEKISNFIDDALTKKKYAGDVEELHSNIKKLYFAK